jgi:hypothetical protein
MPWSVGRLTRLGGTPRWIGLKRKMDMASSGLMRRRHPAWSVQEEAVMPFALRQPTLDASASPSFCAGRQLGDVEQALLRTMLHEDPQDPSRVFLEMVAARQRPLAVSIRYVNRWWAQWQVVSLHRTHHAGIRKTDAFAVILVYGGFGAFVEMSPGIVRWGAYQRSTWGHHSAGYGLSDGASGSSGASTVGISVWAKSWPLNNRGSPVALAKA